MTYSESMITVLMLTLESLYLLQLRLLYVILVCLCRRLRCRSLLVVCPLCCCDCSCVYHSSYPSWFFNDILCECCVDEPCEREKEHFTMSDSQWKLLHTPALVLWKQK